MKEKSVHKSKYRAVKTVVDGIKFDSKKEAKRYGELKMMERAGLVEKIQTQVKFDFQINGVNVGFYKADFVYFEMRSDLWHPVIEDVKGFKTPVYNLKKKLMRAIYGIEIKET